MQIFQVIQRLPDVFQAFLALLLALSAVGTALAVIFKLFGWQKGVDAMAALGLDIKKLISVLQGMQNKNAPAQVEQKQDPPKPPPVGPLTAAIFFGIFAALLLGGCGANIQVTAATAADGTKFPYCLEVTQPFSPVSSKVIILGCATVESVLQEQKAQYEKLYPAPQYKVSIVPAVKQ